MPSSMPASSQRAKQEPQHMCWQANRAGAEFRISPQHIAQRPSLLFSSVDDFDIRRDNAVVAVEFDDLREQEDHARFNSLKATSCEE